MTTEEFKEITRAVVVALRKELTLDNKDILTKLAEVENKLVYDGRELEVGISAAPGNNLSKRTDGLYARNNYITTESSPVGEIIAFMGTKAPEHYLFCDGTEYSIGDYPVLEAFFQEQFGSVNHFGGDGTTTFAVPDLRGEFLRGTGENSRISETTGMPQGNGADVGEHQNATNQVFVNSHSPSTNFYISKANNGEIINDPTNEFDSVLATTIGRISVGGTNDGYKDDNAVYTTRPTNTSVLYCIKYEPTSVDEIRFLVTRPDLWPANEEVNFGNGLYGIRKTGTITATAETTSRELLASDGMNVVSFGGWFVMNSSKSIYAIGQSSDFAAGNYQSAVLYSKSGGGVVLQSKCPVDRVDAEFDCWVTYTK